MKMNEKDFNEYSDWVHQVLSHGWTEPGFITSAEQTQSKPNPDLEPVDIIVYNREGKIIFEQNMPEVEFMKSFSDLFDHVERINKGHTFRVW